MNNFKLFSSFDFHNNEEFQSILNTLNKEQSIFFLINSVKYAHRQGIYTLEEAELISNCIRTLYSPDKDTEVINEKRDE